MERGGKEPPNGHRGIVVEAIHSTVAGGRLDSPYIVHLFAFVGTLYGYSWGQDKVDVADGPRARYYLYGLIFWCNSICLGVPLIANIGNSLWVCWGNML